MKNAEITRDFILNYTKDCLKDSINRNFRNLSEDIADDLLNLEIFTRLMKSSSEQEITSTIDKITKKVDKILSSETDKIRTGLTQIIKESELEQAA